MSSLEIVSFTKKDIPGITALNGLHYENNDLSSSDYFSWKFFQCPHGPARIIVCKDKTKEGMIVGKTVGIPKEVKIGAHTVMADLMTDILVHPEYRGRGIAPMLAKALYEDCQSAGFVFSYAVANPQSLYFHKSKLKTQVAGEVPLLIRLIDPRGFNERLKGLPFANAILTISQKILQLISWRKKDRQRPGDFGLSIQEITKFDDSFNSFWTTVKNKRPVMVKRSAKYLQWRFGDVPHRAYQKWVVIEKGSGQIRGYIVVRIMEVNDIKCGMIADLMIENTGRGLEAGKYLISEAVKYFQNERVALSGCLMLPGTVEFDLLRMCGHFVCPRRFQPQPFPIIQEPQAGDLFLQSYYSDLKNWFFTMGDFDVV